MSPRGRQKSAGALAPTLRRIINALEHQDGEDWPDEGRALRALGELAVEQIPALGVFAPTGGYLDGAIDRTAKKYCGLKKLQDQFFSATASVEPFAKRDEIESAANHLRTVSDRAHFYAGLAFGITFVEYGSIR